MTFRDFIHLLLYRGLEHFGKYYSSYRGYVTDNEDPDGVGRLRIKIPVVTGENPHTKWIFPKGVYSGKDYGIQLLPEVGDMVWVEFEQGNTEFPYWSHGHFGKGEKPKEFVNSKVYGFKTPKGQIIVFDEREGETYITLPKAGGGTKKYGTKIISFNKGENGGLVKVKELTDELNEFKKVFNSFMLRYDNHVHIDPISGFTGVPAPVKGVPDMATPRPLNIKDTDQDNIENTKILH